MVLVPLFGVSLLGGRVDHALWVFAIAGISDALFVDNKQVWTGPPPSYEKIHRLIEKQVKRLG